MIPRLIISIEFAIAFSVPTFFLIVAVISIVFGLAIVFFSWDPQLFREAFSVFTSGGFYLVPVIVGGVAGLWVTSQLFCRMWNPELDISSPRLVLVCLGLGCCALAVFLYYSYSTLPKFMFFCSLFSYPVTLQLILINRDYLSNAH